MPVITPSAGELTRQTQAFHLLLEKITPIVSWPDGPGFSGVGDSPAFAIHHLEPEYTAAARAARIEGVVSLTVTVLPDGLAGGISVVRSLDPGLDAKAIECVQGWRFRPAYKDGQPVAATVTAEVRFQLQP